MKTKKVITEVPAKIIESHTVVETQYIAEDGEVFSTERECKLHEEKLKKLYEIKDVPHVSFSGYSNTFDGEYYYISNSSELEKVVNYFAFLKNQVYWQDHNRKGWYKFSFIGEYEVQVDFFEYILKDLDELVFKMREKV